MKKFKIGEGKIAIGYEVGSKNTPIISFRRFKKASKVIGTNVLKKGKRPSEDAETILEIKNLEGLEVLEEVVNAARVFFEFEESLLQLYFKMQYYAEGGR